MSRSNTPLLRGLAYMGYLPNSDFWFQPWANPYLMRRSPLPHLLEITLFEQQDLLAKMLVERMKQ